MSRIFGLGARLAVWRVLMRGDSVIDADPGYLITDSLQGCSIVYHFALPLLSCHCER